MVTDVIISQVKSPPARKNRWCMFPTMRHIFIEDNPFFFFFFWEGIATMQLPVAKYTLNKFASNDRQPSACDGVKTGHRKTLLQVIYRPLLNPCIITCYVFFVFFLPFLSYLLSSERRKNIQFSLFTVVYRLCVHIARVHQGRQAGLDGGNNYSAAFGNDDSVC